MLSDPYLVALHEVIQAVARQTDPRLTLALVAEKARALTGASTAAVMLLDDTRTLLDFAAVAGPDAQQMVGQTVFAQDAMAGNTALTGEPYLVHNPAESQPLIASLDPDLNLGIGVRSAAVVPIYIGGKPSGALAALNREDQTSFGGDDILRLQVLANAAALAQGVDYLKREAKRQRRERDILFEAARATSSSLNVQDVLRNVLSTVSDSMEMASGAVFLLNDERTRLYIGAHQGLGPDDQDRQMSAETGFGAQILSEAQPFLVADTLHLESSEDLPLPEARSLIAAPMVARSTTEGILVVGSRQAGAYTPEDARLLSAVASQAAVALENAWLYEDATRRAQEATAIYELSQAVGATLQLDRMLNFVADSVLGLLHVDKFALFLHDPRSNCLEIKIARNLRRETVELMRPRLGEGIAGWVMEFETPTAVQDVGADHRNRSCPIDGEGVTSLVSVPLQSGDQVIGVLLAMSSRRRLFTVGEMELLYTIANQVGAGIANAQMYHEARQKSGEIRKYVRRVARALGSSLASQESAQVITDLAVEISGTKRSVLYVIDNLGHLVPRAASYFKSPLNQGWGGDLSNTPAAWIARRGRSLVVDDLLRDTRFTLPPFASRDRVCGYLGVPLKVGKNTLGVLEVYTKEPRRFTADEMRLLITFASQASVGLQNVLLVEQASRRLADLQVIGTISENLASAAITDLFPDALRSISEATQSELGILHLFSDADPLSVYHRIDDTANRCSIEAIVAQTRDWAKGENAFSISTLHRVSTETCSGIVAPLRQAASRSLVGTITLCRTNLQPAFDSYDRQLLTTVANLISTRL